MWEVFCYDETLFEPFTFVWLQFPELVDGYIEFVEHLGKSQAVLLCDVPVQNANGLCPAVNTDCLGSGEMDYWHRYYGTRERVL